MKYGHKYSQLLFQELGEKLGYHAKKSYAPSLPTDGVWLIKHPLKMAEEIPLIAIEVVVSESMKCIRGSIRILEEVSPVIAIIIIHKSEMESNLLKKGIPEKKIVERMEKINRFILEETMKSNQRFEIWSEQSLDYLITRILYDYLY